MLIHDRNVYMKFEYQNKRLNYRWGTACRRYCTDG